MTYLPEIWDFIRQNLARGKWTSFDEIYKLVENNLTLDEEDFKPQSPSSKMLKWKRNVRNVLQYRKRKEIGEIDKSYISSLAFGY